MLRLIGNKLRPIVAYYFGWDTKPDEAPSSSSNGAHEVLIAKGMGDSQGRFSEAHGPSLEATRACMVVTI